jgi:hypothetical protein
MIKEYDLDLGKIGTFTTAVWYTTDRYTLQVGNLSAVIIDTGKGEWNVLEFLDSETIDEIKLFCQNSDDEPSEDWIKDQ